MSTSVHDTIQPIPGLIMQLRYKVTRKWGLLFHAQMP